MFCNAPWTDDMLKIFADADMATGYYGDHSVERIDAVVDVTCSSCSRLVYRKEISGVPFTGG